MFGHAFQTRAYQNVRYVFLKTKLLLNQVFIKTLVSFLINIWNVGTKKNQTILNNKLMSQQFACDGSSVMVILSCLILVN